MTDAKWGYDAADFPLPSLTDDATAILQLGDPALFQLCSFFSQVLNINLQPRFSNEAAACGMTHANLDNWQDGYVVAQTVAFPLTPTLLKVTAFQFPLLSIYPEKESFHSISLMKNGKKRDLVVSWILPPLTPFQYNRLYPFLGIASNALEVYGMQGLDPKINPNRSVWNIANISFGTLQGVEYKPYLGLDKDGKNAYFPSIQFRLSFFERNQVVDQGYLPLENIYIEQDLIDGYDLANPIKNFIDGYANPNLSFTSISPNSGSVQGGTWINILGTGFNTNVIRYPWQITVCGAQASSFVIINNNTMRVITSPSVDRQPGLGDLVITDTVGNVTTYSNCFTYTLP